MTVKIKDVERKAFQYDGTNAQALVQWIVEECYAAYPGVREVRASWHGQMDEPFVELSLIHI